MAGGQAFSLGQQLPPCAVDGGQGDKVVHIPGGILLPVLPAYILAKQYRCGDDHPIRVLQAI